MVRIIAVLMAAFALIIAPIAVAPASAAGAVVTASTSANSEALGRSFFQISWSGPSDAFGFTVDTSSGTAIEGTDFTGVHTPYSYAASAFAGNAAGFNIPIADDALIEGPETFTITLSNITRGATFSQTVLVVTIADNDPSFAIGDASVTEGNAGTSLATFIVTQNTASTSTTSVNYATANGTASAGTDYIATSGTLTFAPGDVTKSVVVTVSGDLQNELDEKFEVNLSAPVNAIVGDGEGIGTIVDDDIPGVSVSDASVGEAASTATFTVTLSIPAVETVTVGYATADGTATAGLDYVAASGTLTFAPGEVTNSVVVAVSDDLQDESDEQFALTLSDPVNAVVGDGEGIGTIVDDDIPALSVSDASVSEDAPNATFTVTLSMAAVETVSVNYATADGTATAGADYVATSGTLTFAPGDLTKSVVVTVSGDLQDEPEEQFAVNLTDPANASIGAGQGIGTIVDDDIPGVSVSDLSVSEDASTATFTVSLPSPAVETMTVDYATIDGTATAGSDYVSTSGTLTFAPGDSIQSVTVPLTGDTIDEADETFVLELTSPAGAVIADGQGIATLTDDDTLPLLAISPSITAPTEGAAGAATTVTLTISRAVASGRDISVAVAGVNGTATNGADFDASPATVSIPAGPGPASVTYTVDILGDDLVEGAEEFTVEMSNPVNAALDAAAVSITITDDDEPATVDDDEPAGVVLAATGLELLPLVALGGMLVLGGLVMLTIAARRRHRERILVE